MPQDIPHDRELLARGGPKQRLGPQAARKTESVKLPEYLPARMLNEFVYCPRLFFYEWVEGVFAHSADTVEGALRHEKLETKADALPSPMRRRTRVASTRAPSSCPARRTG